MAEAEEEDKEVVKVNDDDAERTPKKKRKMRYDEIFEVKKVNSKKKK